MQKSNSTVKRGTAKSAKASPAKSNGAAKPGTKGNSAGTSSAKSGSGNGRTGTATGRPGAGAAKSGAARSANADRSKAPVEDSQLKEFFIDELKDIYWAEQKLVKTLPKLAKAATSEELRDAFESHLEETKTHVQRLEQAFKALDEKAVAKKCDAMEGITEEGASVIEDTEDGTATRDVALVMAGQKAEHYEIATYGGLVQIARTLGEEEVADLLELTLEEEKSADQKLTEIAESGINYEAAEEKE